MSRHMIGLNLYTKKYTHPYQVLVKKDNSLKECSICLEETPTQLFLSGHGKCQHYKNICRNCLVELDDCPYCRSKWS